MKIYVCGPMTGLPGNNYAAFAGATMALRGAGYEVVNPGENAKQGDWKGDMRISVAQVAGVDGLCILDGHKNSNGANLEHTIAQHLSLPVFNLEWWLKCAAMRDASHTDHMANPPPIEEIVKKESMPGGYLIPNRVMDAIIPLIVCSYCGGSHDRSMICPAYRFQTTSTQWTSTIH